MARLVNVVGHRVDPWQGRLMSLSARLNLTNASLSSLPAYTMGLFLLAEGTHASFDKQLARFFGKEWEIKENFTGLISLRCVDLKTWVVLALSTHDFSM
jgi:hypothetical protein